MAGALTIIGVMSMLVASGKGERCNDFRSQLRQTLLVTDEKTGLSKCKIHKYEKENMPKDYLRISREIWTILEPMMVDITDQAFGADGPIGRDRFNLSRVN